MTEKKIFELWVEGYSATGDYATARYLGAFMGESLVDAAQVWYTLQGPDAERNWGSFGISNSGHPSVWGCRIFDNEAEARSTFG